jgi:hypothetical protein
MYVTPTKAIVVRPVTIDAISATVANTNKGILIHLPFLAADLPRLDGG